jgi:ATP-dependent DNA ligase
MTSPTAFRSLSRRWADCVRALAFSTAKLRGEAVACGPNGIANFGRIRYRRHDGDVFMWALDLIELDGEDLRRDPLAVRKATLERVLARAASGIRFNEHLRPGNDWTDRVPRIPAAADKLSG